MLFRSLVIVVTFSATVIYTQRMLEDQDSGRKYFNAVRGYRGLQILAQRLHVCFSSDVWPATIFAFSSTCICMFSLTIRFDDTTNRVTCAIVFAFFLAGLWGFLEFGSRFHNMAQIFAHRLYHRANGRAQRRLAYSCVHCSSFRVYVGPFGFLDSPAVGVILSMVVQYICTVLINTKPKHVTLTFH